MNVRVIALCAPLLWLVSASGATPVRHYVFFGQDREKILTDSAFLTTRSIEGAQITYSWRQLEPDKDRYDFSAIRADLEFLKTKNRKLFVQLQDVSFSDARVNVPRYLLADTAYHGGVAKQYNIRGDDEAHATPGGWVSRRWDPAVQQRWHALLFALGREFDGQIEGINTAESAVVFGVSGALFPAGYTAETYRDAIISNMKMLRRAFSKSVVIQYANFMPGEWRPTNDRGYLRSVYEAARALGVGVGGPDLLPNRPGQLGSSYPLIRESAGIVPVGIAVQDGNYDDVNAKTGKRITVPELIAFAATYLKADYVFWCTQEPFYSTELIPVLADK